jgi:hypothetical protein
MRTTLDIERDILLAAKELAVRERSTTGRVISELARKGLASTRAETQVRNGISVIASRGDTITNEHVRRLMDEEGV